MRPMNVLMTADAVGGVFTYVLELAAGLADHDVEVTLALAGPPADAAQRQSLAAAAFAAVEERPFALEWMDDPWDDVDRTGHWLLDLVVEHDADLVHLNGLALGAFEFGVPTLVAAHSCVLSWHEAVRRRPAGPEWARYRDAVTAGIAGADVLVAPTRALLAELRRLYGPACRSEAIANGMSADGFSPLPKKRYVLGVGRAWDEAKNLAALERAGDRLPAPVVVAGDGSRTGRLERERLRELYGEAMIFAEPARYEPFGLAALEAGLSGCALVLGDIPTLREVWDDAAVYVDPFEDAALAAVLERLLADELECERLGRAARRRALSYTREGMAKRYVDVYRTVTASANVEVA